MKRRLIIGTVCLVVLAGAGLYAVHWAAGSSEGSVQVGSKHSTPAPILQPVAIHSLYFTTQLPAEFDLKRQTETPADSQTQLRLVADTPSAQDQQFAATVGTIPAGGLSALSDYNLRQTMTANYARYTPANLPAGAVAFKNVGAAAGLTVFWPHGTHYVALALSTDGGASLSQLETTFSQVVSAWAWQ